MRICWPILNQEDIILFCIIDFKGYQYAKMMLNSSINLFQDAVLYLWRAHNVVNLRVSNTTSDDPVFPKFTFPSPQYCPQCYTQKGKFSEEHVAHFLVDMYSNIDTEYSSNVSFMLEASGLVIFTLLLIF